MKTCVIILAFAGLLSAQLPKHGGPTGGGVQLGDDGSLPIGTTVLEIAPTGTDSTAALQAALDTYNDVKMKCGTFIVTQIIPPSNRTLRGSGPCSIIKAKDAASLDTIYRVYSDPVSNVILRDFAIDGNKANTTGDISGISVDGTNIQVINVVISDTRGRCAQLSGYRSGANDGINLIIEGSTCTNASAAGEFSPGFAITAGSGRISSNTITSASPYSMTAAIDVEPNADWIVGDVLIENNQITNGSISATAIAGGAAAINGLTIVGNTIHGENVAGNGAAVNIDTVAGKVVIVGNRVYSSTGAAAIQVLTTVGALVSDNWIYQNAVNQTTYPNAVGLLLTNTTLSNASGNWIVAPSSTVTGGIKETGTSNTNTFAWNRFVNITAPHTLVGAASRFVYIDQEGNVTYANLDQYAMQVLIPSRNGLYWDKTGGTCGTANSWCMVMAGSPAMKWNGTDVTAFGDVSTTGRVFGSKHSTTSNCSSAASPAVCSAASAGTVVVAAGATAVVVNTTAVTALSEITLTADESLGTKLSVTCNTQGLTALGAPRVTARTASTSFTVAIDVAPTTNPLCLSYKIAN